MSDPKYHAKKAVPADRISTPITPEQVRAVMTAHRDLMAHRRYIAIRTIVRVLFWTVLLIGAWALLAHFDAIPDDYRDTCEALAQTCAP